MGRKKREDVVHGPCGPSCNENNKTIENNIEWDSRLGAAVSIKVMHYACDMCGYLHRFHKV